MGTKPRTPEHFPRMRWRGWKREEAQLARKAWKEVGCCRVVFLDGKLWEVTG